MPFPLKPGPGSRINQGFFRLSSGHVTPVFSPAPFAAAVCLPLAHGPASLRAIRLTCNRDIGRATDGTNLPCSVIARQHGFQRRIKRQHRVLKILAVCARPPFVQHIAGAIQRQAAVFRVVVGAHARHQLADRRPFAPGQFAGFCSVCRHRHSLRANLARSCLPPRQYQIPVADADAACAVPIAAIPAGGASWGLPYRTPARSGLFLHHLFIRTVGEVHSSLSPPSSSSHGGRPSDGSASSALSRLLSSL